MRLIDFAMKHSPLYRTLYHNYEKLRAEHALLASMNGAGPPGQANCDTEIMKKFAQLDEDYKALERENQRLRMDAMVGREFQKIFTLMRNFAE